MNVSEELLLDPENVLVASDVYEGFARASLKEDRPESVVIAGSCFAIAASYASIFDQERAKKLFQVAARTYEEQSSNRELTSEKKDQSSRRYVEEKMAFARTLAACGMDGRQIRSLLDVDRSLDFSFQRPDALAALFLTTTILDLIGRPFNATRLRGEWSEQAYRMESYEVGRLHLPLRQFVRLADFGRDRLQRSDVIKVAEVALARIDEKVSTALRNRHWRLMQTSILPIEPEALALCIAIDLAVRRVTQGEQTLRDILGEESHGVSRAYILVATEFAEPGPEPEISPQVPLPA
jgi:hypothetical protein